MENRLKPCTDLPGCLPGKVAVCGVLEVAVVTIVVVGDVHLTVIVHPQLANNNVVHRGRHLAPCVVVASFWKD